MINWRIYYDDKNRFNSDNPEDAPGYGVVCILQRNELTNRQIVHRHDWYWFEPDVGQWSGGDIHGLLDRLCHRLPVTAVCAGRSVPNDLFAEIMTAADKDPDFPPGGKL